MKILLSAILFVFSCLLSFSQEKKQECNTNKDFDMKPAFRTCYVAYNNDKKKLLHGNYKDGQKVGEWSYYDTDGKLLLKRNYFNNLSYEPIFPKLPKAHKEIGIGLVIQEERDSLGILPFYYIHEKDIVWSSRFYQLNWLADQTSIVSQEIIIAALTQLLQDKSITKYRTIELRDTFTFQTETVREHTIIGFLTRTEAFFDVARQLGEMRTTSLQPLARNTAGDTILLPAIYYPEVRKNLSSFAVKSFDYIQHVDDLFYYSLFDGPIYPRSWKENKLNTNYLSRFENENCFSQREMSFIKSELEHQIRYFNGVNNEVQKDETNFKQFIKKFNADSVFQVSRVKFPLKVEWLHEDSLFYLEKSDYTTMDFSVKKSSESSNKWKQTILETNAKAIIQIRGIDNGIHIDYLFEKIKEIWIFTEIIDGST